MAITFNIQQGGLGRRLPGRDYVSCIVISEVNANLPSGFSTTDRIKRFNSIEQAEAAGITAAGAGNVGILHYHLSEFFRIYGDKTESIGEIWVHIYDSLVTFADSHITDVQTLAEGAIRQFAVYPDVVFAASLVTTAATAAATMLSNREPAVIVMGGNFETINLIDLPDIRALNAQFVSVDLSQDGSGTGKALADAASKSVNGLGTLLGTIAAATVSQNIGWVQEFDISDSTEFQQPFIARNEAVDSLSASDLATLVTKGYIFARKRQGIVGSFYNDSPQAVAADNDFAFIENSRTIQKAIREINAAITPFINAPLQVNATNGQLTEMTILEIESAVFVPLNQMGQDLEISVDPDTGRLPNNAVFIDPDQDVLSTSQVIIVVRIVPVGVLREIVFNIGFTPQLN